MGTNRTLNKQPKTRPKKSPIDRRRREANHKKRLMAFGYSEEALKQMTSKEIRQLLQHPNKLKAAAES